MKVAIRNVPASLTGPGTRPRFSQSAAIAAFRCCLPGEARCAINQRTMENRNNNPTSAYIHSGPWIDTAPRVYRNAPATTRVPTRFSLTLSRLKSARVRHTMRSRMTRKGRFAAMAAVIGLPVSILVSWTVVLPLVQSPAMPWHMYKASELKALPEASLAYPGSTFVSQSQQDEESRGFEPPQQAELRMDRLFTGSPQHVEPWYRSQLELRGWSPATPRPAYVWIKGHYSFVLAVCGDGADAYFYKPGPCTGRFEVQLLAA